jgi:hypothetical protein
MQRIIDWLKNLRPLKIFTAFLAGVFLLTAQACNRPGIAAQPSQPAGQAPNVERYDPTKSYPLNAPQGGMNNFSDVDPRARAEEKAAEAKAKALRDMAKRNVEQKGVKNLGEDVGSSAEEVREGVAKGTQRGLENIRENTQNAAEDLVKNVQRGATDTGKGIQRRAEDTADAVNRTIK